MSGSEHIVESVDKSVSTTGGSRASRTRRSRVRARKARWTTTGSNEQEVYHTVVVNYHYGDPLRANVNAKKRDVSTKATSPVTPTNSIQEDEDEFVPNLSTLYDLSEVEESEQNQSIKAAKSVELERVNMSIYNVPSQQCAIIEETKQLPTLQFAEEVIILSDSEEGETETDSKEQNQQSIEIPKNNTKESQTKKSFSSVNKRPIRKARSETVNIYRQQQMELHRFRVAVEQKRLQLLEAKLARECDEMERERWLFEKEVELKNTQLKQLLTDVDKEAV